MRHSRYLIPLLLLTVLALGAASCSEKKKESTSTSGIGRVACDESFENILSEEIDVFEYIYPEASIMPYYVPEKAAFDSLLDRKVKCVIASRELNAAEQEYLRSKKIPFYQQQIAVDAVALIVNPSNPVEQLSTKDVVDILTGTYTRWSDIEPCDLGDIQVVFDDQASSVVRYMRDSVMGGKPFGSNVFAQKSSAKVFDVVAQKKDAIGIIGVSWISYDLTNRDLDRQQRIARLDTTDVTTVDFNEKIKVLAVQGETGYYKPYQAYLLNGEYPFHRPIYMIVSGANGSIDHGFFTFVTSFRGQKLILSTGVMPAVYSPTQQVSIN